MPKITTPVAKLKARELAREQIAAHYAPGGLANLGAFEIDSEGLARAAKAAYQVFVREAGFQHDARIVEWEKLQAVHQRRWEAIARAVIEASRGEGERGGERSVQHDDARPSRVRQGNTKASAQVSRDRNRGARRK